MELEVQEMWWRKCLWKIEGIGKTQDWTGKAFKLLQV